MNGHTVGGETIEERTSPRPIRQSEFQALRRLVYEITGVSLADSKRDMLASRLLRRLRHLGLHTYADYYRYLLENDPDGTERQEFINCVTTNKTDFFRESHHFDFLRDVLLPARREQALRGAPRRLRIWSSACSTGEEPYTLAITLLEHLSPLATWDVRILASDIDTQVLRQAELGIYPENRTSGLSEELLHRYFLRGKGANSGQVRVRPEVRNLVTFRQINLIDPDWPIHTRFDAIFCRNVLIYFDRPTQQKLLDRFADFLVPGGYLFLGHSENIHRLSDRYHHLGGTIHQLRSDDSARPAGVVPASTPQTTAEPVPSIPIRNLIVGDVVAESKPTLLRTLLGSCVAACIYDLEAGVGGMNHFSLPGLPDEGCSTRYGMHAMELLINEVMKRGGDRHRLRAKVFGGARVLRGVPEGLTVGERNAQFVLEYLQTEGIPVVSKCLGGTSGLRIHFFTHLGKVLVKPLDGNSLGEVADEEARYSQSLLTELQQPREDVTCWD